MDGLEAGDRAAAAVQKTPNRITLDSMKAKIDVIETLHPPCCPTMTIAVVKLKSGYVLVGKSAPADPENFDPELGEKFATEDAIRQMWPLEGYLLREQLAAD
jgi:hypothetical protein